MSNSSNTTDPYLTPYEDPQLDRILGFINIFLHIPNAMAAFTSLYGYYHLHYRQVKQNRKSLVTHGDVLMGNIVLWLALCSPGFGSNFMSGFRKRALVVGNDKYTPDQVGYYNSGPSALCYFQAWIWQVGVSGVSLGTGALGLFLYLYVKPSLNTNVLKISKPNQNVMYFLYLIPLWGTITTTAQMLLSEVGPTSSIYCGVRCIEDYGDEDKGTSARLDGKWNNPGKCWMRMVSVYGNMPLAGIPAFLVTGYCGIALRRMTKNSGLQTGQESLMKAVWKMINYSLISAVVILIAFLSRLRQVLTPNYYTEGRAGTAEISWLIVVFPLHYVLSYPFWKKTRKFLKEGNKVHAGDEHDTTAISDVVSTETGAAESVMTDVESTVEKEEE